MFEMLMLLGFLYAGFAHMAPQAEDGTGTPETLLRERRGKKGDKKGGAGAPAGGAEKGMRGGRRQSGAGGKDGERMVNRRNTSGAKALLRERRLSGTT